MNVKEIVPGSYGTLQHYFAITCILTAVTIWIIVAFQSRNLLRNMSVWERIGWPVYLMCHAIGPFRTRSPRDESFPMSNV